MLEFKNKKIMVRRSVYRAVEFLEVLRVGIIRVGSGGLTTLCRLIWTANKMNA